MRLTLLSTLAVGAAMFAASSGTALAAATYCSVAGSPNTAGMKLSDLTFSGNTPTTSADDCYGIVAGNESQTSINGLNLTWGTNWTFLVKDESESGSASTGSFGGISYSLNGFSASTSGNWTLNAGPAGSLPVFVDFIAVLKGTNEHALWFFDDVKIDGSDNGTWQSVFTNNNFKLQDLSHISLYIRNGRDPGDPPVVIDVPEPATLALVGLALFAAGAARRRARSG